MVQKQKQELARDQGGVCGSCLARSVGGRRAEAAERKRRIIDNCQNQGLTVTSPDTTWKLLVTRPLWRTKKKWHSKVEKGCRLEVGTDPNCRMQQTNVTDQKKRA